MPAYVDKRVVEKRDGSGTFAVRVYTPEHVEARDRGKARRLETMLRQRDALRAAVLRGLREGDPRALAVALMDLTYERVGGRGAANGHYGVTTWEARHFRAVPGGFVVRYVGKSGVKQEKRVTDPRVVPMLRRVLQGKDAGERVVGTSAAAVNTWLAGFGITAKDVRGLNANEEVRTRLATIRAAGPRLSWGDRETQRVLKAEFREALGGAARAVGHTPGVLRKQYLVPALEETYLRTGKVIDRLDRRKRRGG